MSAAPRSALALFVLLAAAAARGEQPSASATLTAPVVEAAIGDPLAIELTVTLPSGSTFTPPALEGRFGEATLLDGAWGPPEAAGERTTWRFTGHIAAYRVGESSVPRLAFDAADAAGAPLRLETAPLTLTITSVLELGERAEGATPEIADLKEPATIPADYRVLVLACAILGLALALSGGLWWIHRRYGARLSAVAAPDDPFAREAPHAWIYRELQRLLERRLAEQGRIDFFFEELARLLKTYLAGRYRVELAERTTAEVAPALAQAGAPSGAVERTIALLEQCDRVKFAGERPEAAAWRLAVEAIYAIVDATRPAEGAGDEPARGAA